MIRDMRTCAVVLLLVLTACSGGSSVDSPKGLADELGCSDTYRAAASGEIGVAAVGECEVSGQTVRLLTFASDDARDGFVAVAKGFGGRYVMGDKYAVEVQSAAAEQDVRDAL